MLDNAKFCLMLAVGLGCGVVNDCALPDATMYAAAASKMIFFHNDNLFSDKGRGKMDLDFRFQF